MKPATLLLIEDDRDQAMLVVEMLRASGFRLLVATTAADGHARALSQLPDLILLDAGLPDGDGRLLCRRLRDDARTADIPVIMLTAQSEQEAKRAGFDAGASDYVTKPFDAPELIARIRVHLRRPAQPAEPAPDTNVPMRQELHRTARLVAETKARLVSDLATPPSLERIARQLATNEKRLAELFRAQTGQTPFEYLRAERQRRACALLIETDLSIGEIALRVGFTSQAAFATAFRERFGLTPRDFRRSAGLVPEDPPA